MRAIAIPVADRTECEAALEVAFDLTKTLGADLTGFHLIPDPEDADLYDRVDMAAIWASGGRAAWPDAGEVAARNAERARAFFDAAAQRHGLSLKRRHGKPGASRALYQEIQGAPDQVMRTVGPVNDLMVVSRPLKKGSGIKSWIVMMAALMDGGAPVLLLPQRHAVLSLGTVAVAWKGGRTEAALVRASIPLLRMAGEVCLLTAGKGGGTSRGRRASADAMVDYLRANGIEARHRKVEGKSEGQAIEQAAVQMGAGLILSGAYTRGRLREIVFGGVTEYLVTRAAVPVLMYHP